MAEEKKTATIKIYRDSVPRITITYKNKKDLFKTFQKKLKELNLPINEVYFTDWDNDRIMIRTADDLFAAANNLSVKMYYYTTDDKKPFTYLSSGEDDEESGKEKGPEKEGEPRSTAPARRRHRSRSASYHGSRHGQPSCYQIPWNFVPWSYMMDSRYGPMPFPPYPHHSSKSHRRRRERSCHCSCERLCKDFANL